MLYEIMSLFDKLKGLFKPKKLEKPEKRLPRPKPKKPVKKVEKVERPTPKPIKKPKVRKIPAWEISKLILTPQITEKATDLKAQDKYIFKVARIANKSQIKKAVQALYGVKVISVNIINIHRKSRRIGRTSGFKPGYKKAVVTLAKGEKIEMVKGV